MKFDYIICFKQVVQPPTSQNPRLFAVYHKGFEAPLFFVMRFYDTSQAENGEGHVCFILRGKNPVTPSPFPIDNQLRVLEGLALVVLCSQSDELGLRIFLAPWGRRCGHKLRYKRWVFPQMMVPPFHTAKLSF